MNYFIDTEFLEGTQKSLFGNTKPTIDLISIGIVSEDNREYYAISKDFNLKEAWNRYDLKPNSELAKISPEFRYQKLYNPYYNSKLGYDKEYWIRNNVLKPIYYELCLKDEEPLNSKNNPLNFSYKKLKYLINKYGKSNKQIAEEIIEFVYKGNECSNNLDKWGKEIQPKFYGYYSAYDHVALCWLFGKMIDLPRGFPMIVLDIQQIIDENNIDKIKLLNQIPQINYHNALSDAIWNREAYNLIQKTRVFLINQLIV